MIVETSHLGVPENRALDYFQNIVETVREPLVVLDSDLRVLGASRSFYQTFNVTPEETEGRLIYELGDRQWAIPALRTLLEEITPRALAVHRLRSDACVPACRAAGDPAQRPPARH